VFLRFFCLFVVAISSQYFGQPKEVRNHVEIWHNYRLDEYLLLLFFYYFFLNLPFWTRGILFGLKIWVTLKN